MVLLPDVFIENGKNMEETLVPVGSTVLRKLGFQESKWHK